MKTLNDVKQDMSDLYEQVKNGAVDVKTASELANITGKFLKAEQLELARRLAKGEPVAPLLTRPPSGERCQLPETDPSSPA